MNITKARWSWQRRILLSVSFQSSGKAEKALDTPVHVGIGYVTRASHSALEAL